MRLADYPYVVVRVACRLCARQGQYRLARLAERFGAETDLERVLEALAADCRWQIAERRVRKYEPRCGIALPDIDYNGGPPDTPESTAHPALRVVKR